MKQKKIISLLLAATLSFTLLAGCGSKTDEAATDTSTDAAATTTEATEGAGEVREFTAFFAVAGTEINDDNEIQSILAEKTGVKVKETWLTGQTDKEAIGTFIAGGEYPDFIEGGSGTPQLIDAGALVALDDYIAKYPNIKALFSEEDWDKLRQAA